jgi:membrane associated rhomboid family serine protease
VVVGIVCGLLWIGVSFIVPLFTNALLPAGMTASGCAYGIVGAFGVLFYRRRFWFFFWTIEAQQFAWLVVAIGLVIGIAWPPMWVWVAGAGVAYLYLKLTWGARDIWAGRRAAQRSRFEGLG